MIAEHLSIDGSVVSIEADTDLGNAVTATGWAIVPSIARAHPFRVSPSGYSQVVERTVQRGLSHVRVSDVQEFSLKGGNLRVAEVEVPTATGDSRKLTVGGWEGRMGCLSTSLRGWVRGRLVEMFDSLQFSEGARGLAIDSPVTPRPREPQVIKEVEGLGILCIRPALAHSLQAIPRTQGATVDHGELFRVRAGRRTLVHVSPSAVTWIDPIQETETERSARDARDADEALDRRAALAASLRIEWRPRRAVR